MPSTLVAASIEPSELKATLPPAPRRTSRCCPEATSNSRTVRSAAPGEFVGSDRGLGYLLLTSTGTLDGTLVWSALFVLIAMGIALFTIVSKLERLAIPWHVSVRAEETAAYQS